MANDPAFLFYPADWVLGTMGMTIEQKGAYLELLMMQFSSGKFTESQAKQVLSTCEASVWEVVKLKFCTDGVYFWNKRLREEKEKRQKFSESRRINALGGKSDKKDETDSEAHAQHMGNGDINEDGYIDETEILQWPTFEDFWNEYDKKVGKGKSEKLWNKLKQKQKEEAFYYIADYKDSKPDKKYRKDPERYIKYETWNDEIIKRNNGSGITEDDLREISGKITN